MNKILLIISGSIAASRCKEIITLLNNKEVNISCMLTKEAKKYVKISDIKKLLKNRIFTDEDEKKNKMLHINLSRDNDIIVMCPATANSIAKFANGYGDNLASNTLLASNKKILFVPAMNSFMWHNKINQKNVRLLKDSGHEFIGPKVGYLKCGEFGLGRIDNSKNIVNRILNRLENVNLLKNKKCLVTAGPTIEMIDPVRFIGNNSSGKMGYHLAKNAQKLGAIVKLVIGPTNIQMELEGMESVRVESSDEMFEIVKKSYKNSDIIISAAAISDFKPKSYRDNKIKKNGEIESIELEPTIDILSYLGKNKTNQYLVGFALETENFIRNANKKLNAKSIKYFIKIYKVWKPKRTRQTSKYC